MFVLGFAGLSEPGMPVNAAVAKGRYASVERWAIERQALGQCSIKRWSLERWAIQHWPY